MKVVIEEITCRGATLCVYVDKDGFLVIDLDTSEIEKRFVHEGEHNIPKVRFVLNEEDRRTDEDGDWVPF